MVPSLAALTSAGVISMDGGTGIGIGGSLISILLIVLLSSKELISSSTLYSPKVWRALDLAIVPLLIVFALNITYIIII